MFLRFLQVFNLFLLDLHVSKGLLEVQLQLAYVSLGLLAGLWGDLGDVAQIEHVLYLLSFGERS